MLSTYMYINMPQIAQMVVNKYADSLSGGRHCITVTRHKMDLIYRRHLAFRMIIQVLRSSLGSFTLYSNYHFDIFHSILTQSCCNGYWQQTALIRQLLVTSQMAGACSLFQTKWRPNYMVNGCDKMLLWHYFILISKNVDTLVIYCISPLMVNFLYAIHSLYYLILNKKCK